MVNKPEDILRWEAAAAKGDLAAQHLLALALRSGDGVAKDKKRGTALLFEAAEKGERDAMSSVGVAYYFGDGVPKNHRLAMKWYLAGAAAGSAYGVCNVGDLFDDSDEFPKNPVEAMAWFACSLDQIDPSWERMRQIAGKLSEQGMEVSALRAVQIHEALKNGSPLDLVGDFKSAPAQDDAPRSDERGPVTLLSYLARFHHHSRTEYSEALLKQELLDGASLIYLPAANPPPGEPESAPGQMRLGCLGNDEQGRASLFVYDDAWGAREKMERDKSYAVPSSTLRELIAKLGIKRLVLNAGLQDAWAFTLGEQAGSALAEKVAEPVNPEDPKGYYALIGVRPWATTMQIFEAYQRFQKKHAGEPEALRRGAEAFAVLNDSGGKAAYDARHGAETKRKAYNERRKEEAYLMARSQDLLRPSMIDQDMQELDKLINSRKSGGSCALPFVLFLAGVVWALS